MERIIHTKIGDFEYLETMFLNEDDEAVLLRAKALQTTARALFPEVDPDIINGNTIKCPVCEGLALSNVEAKIRGKMERKFPNASCLDCGAATWAARNDWHDKEKWK